jgi:hypothetical protein
VGKWDSIRRKRVILSNRFVVVNGHGVVARRRTLSIPSNCGYSRERNLDSHPARVYKCVG